MSAHVDAAENRGHAEAAARTAINPKPVEGTARSSIPPSAAAWSAPGQLRHSAENLAQR